MSRPASDGSGRLEQLRRDLLRIAVLAAVYYGLARLTLSHVLVSGWEVAPVWPPSGVALAAVLTWGYRVWPGLAIGTSLLSLPEAPFPQSAISMAGVTLEAVSGAYLLRRFLGFRPSLERVHDVVALAAVAVVSSIVGAVLGITSFYTAGRIPWDELGTEGLKFWLGDAMGILTVTPMILVWTCRRRPAREPRRLEEAILLVVALVAVAQLVFGGWLGTETALGALGAVFPFLVWAALRFGAPGASAALLLVSSLGVWGTSRGYGPFIQGTFDRRMVMLWTFLSLVVLTTMLLAAVTEERRRAQWSLRTSEERFRSLVENANDIIYGLTPEGVFSYVSPNWTRFLGHPVPQVLGNSFDSFVEPEDRPVLRDLLTRVTAGEERPGHVQFRMVHRDGSQRWYSSNLSALRSEGGKVLLLIGIAHDVTEAKKALDDLAEVNRHLLETQNQLVQSEKMAALGMLIAGIAHEINTPVGAIHSMNDTMKGAVVKLETTLAKQPEELQESLAATLRVIQEASRVIESGSHRVSNLVKRLRTFARLDQAELRTVDIHAGIDETVTLVSHDLKKGVKLTRDYGSIPPVTCYPDRLNQVFLNLLVNAHQAVGDQGEITIRTFEKDGKVHVAIRDTGMGIAKEKMAKIFDPGYTTKGVGVGTGLGLSICYKIVQDHHGEIQVESELGKGSTFTVILPLDLQKVADEDRSRAQLPTA